MTPLPPTHGRQGFSCRLPPARRLGYNSPMTQTPPRSILITGASSGLGAALARHYAAQLGASLTLTLLGRDVLRLDQVADACRAFGATVHNAAVDVTDATAMRAAILAADDRAPLDLVIANAGISAGTGGFGETETQVRRITDVNVTGVINTIAPAQERMVQRGRGHLALMASLAGFLGLPGAPAYCASKAWVKVYGESLRGTVAASGVRVSVICPGFVETPMTAVNRFPMPFLLKDHQAARIIADGLARNRARIAFPLPMLFVTWLLASLPRGLVEGLTARLPRKS